MPINWSKRMSLDVELKMLTDGHTHAGRTIAKGEVISTNPNRAARMIAQGFAQKVGVRSKKNEAVAEAPDEGAEDSVDEVTESDDVDDEDTD